MSQCTFQIAWKGRCKNDSILNENMCEVHFDLKCKICANKAIKSCEYTGSSPFVCDY